MSKIYLWDQRYEEAAAVAARGFEVNPQGTAAVLLACQEADAWAEIGAGERARVALNKANEARQTANDDSIGGLLRCNEIRQHNYAGSVLLRIGSLSDAIQHAEMALDAAKRQPSTAYGTIAQIRIWAASAHLQLASSATTGSAGIEGAAEVLNPVLSIPDEKRLDTVVRRLRDVSRFISANPAVQASPSARKLQADIMEFCMSGNARQLPS
jgi:tetratricopeptide (TPR) repeat protein